MRKNQKKVLAGVLAVLLAFVAVGGTIAWLTAQDQLTNQFTVGSIDKPDKPSDPDAGGNEDEDETKDPDKTVDGYLFETEWDESKTYPLTQGVAQAKNPNVGIGKGSAEKDNSAYVFLYVENNSLASTLTGDEDGNLKLYAPYFYLESQWSPVTESIIATADSTLPTDVAPVESTPGNATGVAAAAKHDGQTAYVDGLFMYTNDTPGNTAQVLDANGTSLNATSVYTGELFEDITIPSDLGGKNVQDVLLLDGGNIKVHAFIYAYDGAPEGVDGTADQALKEAIAWANKIANPESGE